MQKHLRPFITANAIAAVFMGGLCLYAYFSTKKMEQKAEDFRKKHAEYMARPWWADFSPEAKRALFGPGYTE